MSRRVLRPLSRFFSTLMVVSLLTLSMAVPMVSAQTATVEVASVNNGENGATVSVRLLNFHDLAGATFTLKFDPTHVTASSAANGNLPAGGYLVSPVIDNAAGTVVQTWAQASGINGTYTFFTVTFKPVATGSFAFGFGSSLDEFVDSSLDAISWVGQIGTYTVLAPNTVWVDDDWNSNTAGDIVGNGYVFGYNAFSDIQPGIDAVSNSTVNVLPGIYSAFNITQDDVQVLGQNGAWVNGGATVRGTSGVTIQNLTFNSDDCTGVTCVNTHDTHLNNLTINAGSGPNGIQVDSGSHTVYIDNPHISGGATGIDVVSDTVYVTGGLIEQFTNYGIHAGNEAYVYISNLEITAGLYLAAGVYVCNGAHVEVTDCSRIHNNEFGFDVKDGGVLVANFNNIYDNHHYGVYWLGTDSAPDCIGNWWGSAEGPVVDYSTGTQDGISSADILHSPWLDKPCNQGGKPVGINAKLQASARAGEPGLKVQFTDLSTPAPGCEIKEWLWDFGDRSTSTDQNPTHIYPGEGVYTVTLTVTDSCGFTNTVTMKAYITIAKKTRDEKVEPAKLGVSYLNIDPAQVLPNQEVLISANICNSGGERGSKTVSLMLNGEAIDSQSVSVSPGACQQVIFKTSRAVPGTYQVAIDGMTGQFSVLAPRTVTRNVPSQQQTGLGTAGIIAIIAVIVVLIVALIMVFKRD